jgi:hypothetical protein
MAAPTPLVLTGTPTAPGSLPELSATSGLAIGHVYVSDQHGTALLDAGQQAVLQTKQGGRLELLTVSTIGVTPTAPGSYLHASDYATLVGQTEPTLRLYGSADTLAKLRGASGFLTALTAVLSTLTALIGVFFVWSAMSAPGPSTINDRAQALLSSVAGSGRIPVPAQTALSCLKQIRGEGSQQVSVPGVDCTAVSTPWWRQSTWGSLLIGLIGVLGAVAGIVTVASKFGFQKSPAG